jgi:hypothetical protein
MKDIEKAIRLGLPAHERNTKHADSFVKGMAKLIRDGKAKPNIVNGVAVGFRADPTTPRALRGALGRAAPCRYGKPVLPLRSVAFRSPDYLALGIARDLEKRGLHVDAKDIEAAVAKVRAAWKGKKSVQRIGQKIKQQIEARRQAALARLIAAAEQRQRAAELRREIEVRAAELKQCGRRNPVQLAEEDIAKRLGWKSAVALNRWIRRHRAAR